MRQSPQAFGEEAMNDINLNGLSGSGGIGRPLNATANQKSTNVKNASSPSDSAEFSRLPDLSAVERTVEEDFASLRSSLQETVNSELYPPLETINKLAAMLGADFHAGPKKPQ